MDHLDRPRCQGARSRLPGEALFWQAALHQSDIFAWQTANAGKGGPFGAQLWLVHPARADYILVGTAETAQDSNAVVSKGRAGAHAEAENLSPEKRQQVIRFLEDHRGEGWKIVQISSGESCPGCRAKQILFADELAQKGLIAQGDFHVLFKATYDQTQRDAGFNDAPYDQTFRAIAALELLDHPDGLLRLESALAAHPLTAAQITSGTLVYLPVHAVSAADCPEAVTRWLQQAGEMPAAILIREDGTSLSIAQDERDYTQDSPNAPERSAIVHALYQAAAHLRETEGKFESWDLEGARLYTNISEIGPLAYAESLWCNLSGLTIVQDYTSAAINIKAQELPGVSNNDLFRQVAADYDAASCPLTVIHGGMEDQPSVAHLFWNAKMAMESLLNQQAERLSDLAEKSGQPLKLRYIDGTGFTPSDLILSSHSNSHYNGKR